MKTATSPINSDTPRVVTLDGSAQMLRNAGVKNFVSASDLIREAQEAAAVVTAEFAAHYNRATLPALREEAKGLGMKGTSKANKATLVDFLVSYATSAATLIA